MSNKPRDDNTDLALLVALTAQRLACINENDACVDVSRLYEEWLSFVGSSDSKTTAAEFSYACAELVESGFLRPSSFREFQVLSDGRIPRRMRPGMVVVSGRGDD